MSTTTLPQRAKESPTPSLPAPAAGPTSSGRLAEPPSVTVPPSLTGPTSTTPALSQPEARAPATPHALPLPAAGTMPSGRTAKAAPVPTAQALSDPMLYLAAVTVDDLERVRIATQNRLRQLTRTGEDADGAERGFGLTEDHPDVARMAAMAETLGDLEHEGVLALRRQVRRHPLGPWVKGTVGVGEKQAARLLAAIGDPYWNTLHDRPRTVSELWAYCGLHTMDSGDPGQRGVDTHSGNARVAAKRRKGERMNWSPEARMRVHLIAESCIKKAHSPYRPVYDTRRARTALTHPEWTPGHSHIDALRIVAKAVLKDMWRQARAVHGVTGTGETTT